MCNIVKNERLDTFEMYLYFVLAGGGVTERFRTGSVFFNPSRRIPTPRQDHRLALSAPISIRLCR